MTVRRAFGGHGVEEARVGEDMGSVLVQADGWRENMIAGCEAVFEIVPQDKLLFTVLLCCRGEDRYWDNAPLN